MSTALYPMRLILQSMILGLGILDVFRQSTATSNNITAVVLATDIDDYSNNQETVYDKHLEQANAIFRWVADNPQAYISNKQVVRRGIPGDKNSPLGVYATARIEPEEVITRVPWDYIIAPENTATDDEEEENEESSGQLSCGLIESLASELRKGKASKFAPYIEYLNDEPDGQIPTSWSEQAVELLLQVVDGQSIPPYLTPDWLEYAREECHVDTDDIYIRRAVLLIIQRSDDEIMIPAYDSYNHRNGKWKNTRTKTHYEEYHETVAMKAIEPGEQILLSYNFCDQCGGRIHQYGTAGKGN
jgi:hypothetical protein